MSKMLQKLVRNTENAFLKQYNSFFPTSFTNSDKKCTKLWIKEAQNLFSDIYIDFFC